MFTTLKSAIRFLNFAFWGLLFCYGPGASGQTVRSTYSTDAGLQRLSTLRGYVYHPDTSWLYSHHPYLVFFKGWFYASWSNGYKDEDQPGQRVALARSRNGLDWQKPTVLAEPGLYRNDTLNVLTAAGFLVQGDSLLAYYGEYSPHRTHTRLWVRSSRDGIHWSEAVDLQTPVNPNLGPQRLSSGRLLICGNFCFPYSESGNGLGPWINTSWYDAAAYKEDNPATFYAPAEAQGLPPLCEGAFFETPDRVVHMLLRVTGKGWKGRLWMTESHDQGSTWSRPQEQPFPDNDSKFHFGQLPGYGYYYMGIPDTLHHYERNPLVLSLSGDGRLFDRHFVVAEQPYELKKEGLWKGGHYGYPYTMIHKDALYVIVSRKKEAIEVIKIPLAQLKGKKNSNLKKN